VNLIKIGTIIGPENIFGKRMESLIPYGFETFAISFWENIGETDLVKLSEVAKEKLEGTGCAISCLSVFGNPLMDDEKGKKNLESWKKLIDAAHLFGVDLVTGFTGRVVGKSVDESMPKFTEVFTELAKRAADKGVRLAFENCDMGGDWSSGDWNIAFTSKAWEMMFNAVPYDNLGLQWEPCHHMVQLVDPIPQLRKWAKKIFNLHGKDATIAWDVIKEKGIHSGEPFAWHRTPGFGDCNWADIFSILMMAGYTGSVEIEGFHDPVYRKELEYTGQVRGLNYLKACRGGEFVPNPER